MKRSGVSFGKKAYISETLILSRARTRQTRWVQEKTKEPIGVESGQEQPISLGDKIIYVPDYTAARYDAERHECRWN